MSGRCASTLLVGRNGRASRSKPHSATSGNGAMRRSFRSRSSTPSDQPVEVVQPQIQISGRAVKKKKKEGKSLTADQLLIRDYRLSATRIEAGERARWSRRLRPPELQAIDREALSPDCPGRPGGPADTDPSALHAAHRRRSTVGPKPRQKGDAMNSNENEPIENRLRYTIEESQEGPTTESPRQRPPLPS
jgi:hypothetical protein